MPRSTAQTKLFSQPAVLWLVLVWSGQWVPADDGLTWNRFRGPAGSGKSSSDGQLPKTWSDSENVRWKRPIPRGSSSPVLGGGKIFLTGYSGYAQNLQDLGDRDALQLHVMAYDLATGSLLWDYAFAASAAEQDATQRIADHGYASSTPCTDGTSVYAGFGPSGIVALDMDGNRIWHGDVGSGTAGFGAASSPIVFQNLVIFNASIESQKLYALDKSTGKVVWSVDGIERAWTTPTIVDLGADRFELVIHFKNEIQGLDPHTGKQLWHCRGIPDYVVPGPVVNDKTVYFSGGRQNRTIAVRAGGRGDVTETHKLWETTEGANVTTPVYHAGHLYWSHDKAFAQCINAATGKSVYRQRFRNRDRVYASVIYGDQKLFMTQRDGTTLVLESSPRYAEIAINQLGTGDEQFNATPAIHENSLIFRSTENLYRIGM